MATLESLRRQIDTAADLGSVVGTMKTLAAAKIHQFERAVEALADYNRTIELGFQIVLREEPLKLILEQPAGKTAAVVFGSDQGMCGRFNEEIVSYVDANFQNGDAKQASTLLAVGARVEGHLLDAGWTADHTYHVPSSVSEISNLVQEILPHIERLRSDEDVSRLFVFYNRRTSASSITPQMLQLLPVDPELLRGWRDQPWQSRSLPMFVTPSRQVLSRLIRHYLFVALFRACAESLASENASRIAAMHAAEKNVEERLEELQRAFNQLRQTAITEELLDVVAGFEALSGDDRDSQL